MPLAFWRRPGGVDLRKRADRLAFEDVLRRRRPRLVCLGPVYKSYQRRGSESDEQVATEVQQVLDDLRTRFRFALVLSTTPRRRPTATATSGRSARRCGSLARVRPQPETRPGPPAPSTRVGSLAR